MFRELVGVLVGRVRVVMGPLEEDHEDEIAEDEEEENHLGDELQDDVRIVLLDQLVPQVQHESEEHVNQTKDQRDLHFVAVQESDLVLGAHPDGIQPHVVRIT